MWTTLTSSHLSNTASHLQLILIEDLDQVLRDQLIKSLWIKMTRQSHRWLSVSQVGGSDTDTLKKCCYLFKCRHLSLDSVYKPPLHHQTANKQRLHKRLLNKQNIFALYHEIASSVSPCLIHHNDAVCVAMWWLGCLDWCVLSVCLYGKKSFISLWYDFKCVGCVNSLNILFFVAVIYDDVCSSWLQFMLMCLWRTSDY